MQNTSRLVHTTGNGGLKQVNSGIDSGLKVQFVPVGKTETAAKKVFLKILKNSLENTCARISFLIKVAGFYRTPLDDCFWQKPVDSQQYGYYNNVNKGRSCIFIINFDLIFASTACRHLKLTASLRNPNIVKDI